jgi:rSAM/selenodomain-associated transferase 1
VFETIPPPPKRLLVFARLPERGAVKTRLAAEIGDDRALAVYEAMLRDTLRSIGGSNDETEVEVMWAPTDAAGADSLAHAFGETSVAMQTGETLGDRLSMAFSERFFFHRTERIIAVGVDDPTIPRPLIDTAFALLESCDWVVGPATDGGYYLIGCRGPAFDNDAFQEIAWGTSSVFTTTIARIREWQRNVAVLPMRTDIDTAEDLQASEWKP